VLRPEKYLPQSVLDEQAAMSVLAVIVLFFDVVVFGLIWFFTESNLRYVTPTLTAPKLTVPLPYPYRTVPYPRYESILIDARLRDGIGAPLQLYRGREHGP
jgi:hypothetical protein